MGFGRGILAEPRRAHVSLSYPAFGLVVSRDPSARNARVITPTRGDFPNPGPDGLPFVRIEFLRNRGSRHELAPLALVPSPGAIEADRNLISDARDLLIETLFKRTAVLDNGTIFNDRSPTLDCIIETPETWVNPAFTRVSGTDTARFIHLGNTSRVESLLRNLHEDPRVQQEYGASGWGGLQSLDGDGYIVATVATGTERHLILTGGSDYGTYFAVAWFLWQFAGARWLFPGELGTVIPQGSELTLTEAFYHIDEPDYRGRTLVGMINTALDGVHTDWEINDTRNWLLRNRFHSQNERSSLYWRRPIENRNNPEHKDNRFCANLSPFKRRFLSEESRIPVGHGLSRFFSPYGMSLDPATLTLDGPQRVSAFPEMYPDARPRVIPLPGSSELTLVQQDGSQPSVLIPQQAVTTTTTSTPCPPVQSDGIPPNCFCPEAPSEREVSILELGWVPTTPATAQGLRDRFSRAIPVLDLFRTSGLNLRFIPRVRKTTHAQDLMPFQGWAPCLFQRPPSQLLPGEPVPENPLAKFRKTVALDLARQLVLSGMFKYLVRRTRDPEFCETLGADDGDGYWCGCTPCRSTNSLDDTGASVVFKGTVILAHYLRAEDRDSGRSPPTWLSQDIAHRARWFTLAFQLLSDSGPTLQNQLGLGPLPARDAPFSAVQPVVDRMALRGVLPDRGRLSVHSRRILVLMNETALALTFGEPGTFSLQREHTLLTFLTYLDYTAPPVFEQDPILRPRAFYSSDPNVQGVNPEEFYTSAEHARELAETVLHPILTPMISGSRDLLEYDSRRDRSGVTLPGGTTIGEGRPLDFNLLSPFEQHRIAPERFNLFRWSKIARQTGFYEWMYGRGNLAPRIYTQRLRNALRDGYENARARVFLAETEPNLGLDGIKFYELARVLWDRNQRLEVIRDEYCQALFGANPLVRDPMRQYFELLETIWCDRDPPTQNPPEQRYTGGFNYGTYAGFGMMGRIGWITELDPFLRTPEDRARSHVPPLGSMPFDRAWRLINQAFDEATRSRDDLLVRRVQYFRRAFGLVGKLIQVYRPVLEKWALVENSVPRLAEDPLKWARGNVSFLDDLVGVTTRMNVTTALMRPEVNWKSKNGFRANVRNPVHQYMMTTGDFAGLGSSLGLGLGPIFMPMGSISTSTPGERHAFFLPYVKEYVDWWRAYGSTMADRDPVTQDDMGIGVSMFLTMKKMIGAMLVISGSPLAETVDNFMRDA